ncbi:MAG: TonB-dependent receptor plug domain-containing protein [Bacteroidota bacterium]
MKPEKLFVCVFCVILVASCSNNKQVVSDQGAEKPDVHTGSDYQAGELTNLDYAVDLTAHLMRIGGISVRGSGASAYITIRGAESNSFNATSVRIGGEDATTVYRDGGGEPMFIFNDIQVASYSDLYNMITPDDIKSIKVLKGPDAYIYGTRAFNGVIIIKSK